MHMLSSSREGNLNPSSTVPLLLNHIFQSIGGVLVGWNAISDRQAQGIFRMKTHLPRVQQQLSLLWQIVTSDRKTSVSMELDVNSCVFSQYLCNFFRTKASEICEHINLGNNLDLCQTKGALWFQEVSGRLGMRSQISRVNYVSSVDKIARVIRKYMQNNLTSFVKNLQNIIFYYRLGGTSQLQLELMQQSETQQLFWQVNKISQLKHCFEGEHYGKIGSPVLARAHTRSVQIATSLLKSEELTLLSRDPQLVQGGVNKVKDGAKKDIVAVNGDFTVFQKDRMSPILTSIDIKSESREQLLRKGGYSSLLLGTYQYIPQLSINEGVTDPSTKKKQEESALHSNSLVKKVTERMQSNPSLLNQCRFLTFMRNKVCPFIAKYFCRKAIVPFADGQIFMEYYPKSLEQVRMKQDKKIKVLQDISMALFFMHRQGVIHRDVKELNIMIDRHRRAKLIDFGSVSRALGNTSFKAVDDKLRATEGYFLSYKEAVDFCPSIQKRMSPHDYYSHPSFDVYSLGKVMENELYLDHIIGQNNFVRNQLRFLSQKCLQADPVRRWTTDEVLLFIRSILVFMEMRSAFWQWRFDRSNRVHLLGSVATEQYKARIEAFPMKGFKQ